jgi:Family of unknown function (DUF5681)
MREPTCRRKSSRSSWALGSAHITCRNIWFCSWERQPRTERLSPEYGVCMANSRSTNAPTRTPQVNDTSKKGGLRPQRSAKPPKRARGRPSNRGYLVGYAQPPKHTQFRPGQSGNPSGQRKKRESLQDIVAKVLFEKTELQIGERTEKIPGVIGLIRIAMNRALQGDYKFLMAVLAFIRLSGLAEIGGDALGPETDTRSDEAIVANFMRRYALSPTNSAAADSKSATSKSSGVHDDSK